jgi:hypothetical protein
LRAFGAGHSPSDLVCVGENDWLINMDKLNKVIDVRGPEIDEEERPRSSLLISRSTMQTRELRYKLVFVYEIYILS